MKLIFLCLLLTTAFALESTPSATRVVTNTASLEHVTEQAKKLNLKTALVGKGALRFLLLGETGIPASDKRWLEWSEQGRRTLQTLEQWTGKQGVFWKEGNDESLGYVMVIVGNEKFGALYDALLAAKVFAAPSEGDSDLPKKLQTLFLARTFVGGKMAPFQTIPQHWVTAITTQMAFGTFSLERQMKARLPAWVTEATSCELQRMLCGGSAFVCAIAYEMSNGGGSDGNWITDVAELIRTKDRLLMSANSIMQIDLISTPPQQYKMLWSYGNWIRMQCLLRPLPKGASRWLALLEDLAKGTDSATAVTQQLNLADPSLTNAWRQWAAGQRGK
jgi:hypothetical protein